MFLLLACASSVVELTGDSGGGAGTDVRDSVPVEQLTGTSPYENAYGCSDLYDPDVLQRFELRIDDASWAALEADYTSGVKQYHPVRFVRHDGDDEEVVDDAAVRLRGNPGFSWFGEKMQFNISFNEFDADGRFHGLRKLNLDAAWYHAAGLRNRLAYSYLRDAGTAAPCANSAFLEVNGEPYGLYENIEHVDQELLERAFGSELATGTLWKYGSEATVNEEASDGTELAAWWASADLATQEALSDVDANLREWSAEAVIVQNDGYWCCSHNFYLYEHPVEGITFVPWDLDYSMEAAPYWADPDTWYRDNGWQPHYDAFAGSAEGRTRLLGAMREAYAAYDADVLVDRLDDWDAQTEAVFAEDRVSSHSPGARASAIVSLRGWLQAREGWIGAWLACQAAGGVGGGDGDGDGASACGDCDDGDAAIGPRATEICNARDDDCDGITDEAPDCGCREVAFGDSRLLLCEQPRTWAAAADFCEAQGGTLGFPSTTEDWYVFWIDAYWDELAWAGITWWWAGASDTAQEGVWRDMAGVPVGPGWAAGEPNGGVGEGCAAVSPSSWQWADGDCAAEMPSVCRLPG